MGAFKKVIVYLIYSYIIILPLVPGKFKIYNIPINGDAILFLIILFYASSLIIIKNSRKEFIASIKKSLKDYLDIFLLIFTILMFISIIYSKDIKGSINESMRFMSYMILYFIIKYDLRDNKLIKKFLYLCITSITLVGIIGIIQYFDGIGILQVSEFTSRIRVASTMENSNNLGAIMVIFLFPLLISFFQEKRKYKKIILLLLNIIVFVNIIISFSRNAWIGLAFGCLVFAIIYNRKLGAIIISLGVIFSFIPQISNRLKEFNEASQNAFRISIWKITLHIIKDNPIIGIGIGAFSNVYATYLKKFPKLVYSYDKVPHPHNIFLKFQSELGIPGSLCFFAILIFIFISLSSFNNKVEKNSIFSFYTGFKISFIAFIIMNLMDNFFLAPKVIALFWILVAIFQSYNCKEGVSY